MRGTSSRSQLLAARRAVTRLLAPLDAAGQDLGLPRATRRHVERTILGVVHATKMVYGRWDSATWLRAGRDAGRLEANVLAVGYRLGHLSGPEVLAAGVQPTLFARRVFGQTVLEREVERVRTYLHTVGYGPSALRQHSLPSVLARLFLLAGRPSLEAVTVDLLQVLHQQMPPASERRSACFRLARALHGMGLIPRPIAAHPYRTDALGGVDPVWAAWCERWRATSPLAPKTVEVVYYGALKAGRWLAQHHPTIQAPDQWTRELAAAYVAAVNQFAVGDFSVPGAHPARRKGIPLSARSKNRLLGTLRAFFRDCQEWGWCARHFAPGRAFATPRAITARIGPNPRVIADEVWAKLLWAGLNLDERDLSTLGGIGGSTPSGLVYPHALVKALALTWLFAGLRSDELRRLRVGCIRWQPPNGAGAAQASGDDATCLLDVPVHKTGTSFTKPVDPLVGEAIAAWERQRPVQPLLVDPKTGEQVAFLFCRRGRPLSARYLNRTLIPLLCCKAGVPPGDARGRITSHRARSTIATQLSIAKEPMTLFELQEWLGHRSPQTTQYYARITPTQLAKAYADADYFARNLRTISVLIDRDVIASGAAARGEPWHYFDLGPGYCTYNFFETCPHRMACARCDFYLPKGSAKAQFLEAKGNLQRMLQEIPLTDDERSAVEDGAAAVEKLLERLADVPTPSGPTPRQLSSRTLIPLRTIARAPANSSQRSEVDT